MNRRLLTPTIGLVSFATAFGFMSWHAGLWHRAPVAATAAASPATPVAARQSTATVVTVPAAAPPESEPSSDRPADTDEFLAAQDRAASHSSRSR